MRMPKVRQWDCLRKNWHFYDALTKPQAIKDYYQNQNEHLVALTKDLTESLKKSRTIDWQKKESATRRYAA